VAAAALLVVTAVAIGSCRDGSGTTGADDRRDRDAPAGPAVTDRPATSADGEPPAEPVLPSLALDLRPGPYQLTVDRVPDRVEPGDRLEAAGPDGSRLAVATVSDDGNALFRELEPGPVTVRLLDGDRPVATSDPVEVPGDEPPDEALYRNALLEPGYSYLETRDGTTLSVLVTLPGPEEDGPYPTLVEYSGYQPSRPEGWDPTRLIVPSLGYALVQVNVRGTGCSGGSFDAFEPIQALDGYDVIETVAAQGWSTKVGMFGVSYAGIMQLLVAATAPPSLAAIAPLSVFARIDEVIHPGGIFNDGFARTWAEEIGDSADAFGQGWEQDRVDAGDPLCAANQTYRAHNPDLVERARSSPHDTDLLSSRSPITAAGRVEVPVFLAGAWQDEQTGPDWPALIEALSGAPALRVVLYNGLHVDGISPEVLNAVTEFYDLYLDDPDPGAGIGIRLALSVGLAAVYGDILPVSFVDLDDDRARARADYEAADPIHVRFDVGAGRPNLPVAGFEATFDQWPPKGVEPTAYRFGTSGDPGDGGTGTGASGTGGDQLVLAPDRPTSTVEASFVTDPEEGLEVTIDDRDTVWTNEPDWDWPAPTPGSSLVATSDPLAEDLVLAGPASADLWLSVDGPDADVEVTISEIAPDGSETYVQSGRLRLSNRATTTESTELAPVRSRSEADIEPLVIGEPVLARVAVPPSAHVFRTGSRVAVTIDTPGASLPSWTFDVWPEATTVTLHSSADQPSQVVLPVLEGVSAPTDRPACGSLRGQPCRR
jgi:predicted acyl esterase